MHPYLCLLRDTKMILDELKVSNWDEGCLLPIRPAPLPHIFLNLIGLVLNVELVNGINELSADNNA